MLVGEVQVNIIIQLASPDKFDQVSLQVAAERWGCCESADKVDFLFAALDEHWKEYGGTSKESTNPDLDFKTHSTLDLLPQHRSCSLEKR